MTGSVDRGRKRETTDEHGIRETTDKRGFHARGRAADEHGSRCARHWQEKEDNTPVAFNKKNMKDKRMNSIIIPQTTKTNTLLPYHNPSNPTFKNSLNLSSTHNTLPIDENLSPTIVNNNPRSHITRQLTIVPNRQSPYIRFYPCLSVVDIYFKTYIERKSS